MRTVLKIFNLIKDIYRFLFLLLKKFIFFLTNVIFKKEYNVYRFLKINKKIFFCKLIYLIKKKLYGHLIKLFFLLNIKYNLVKFKKKSNFFKKNFKFTKRFLLNTKKNLDNNYI